MERAVGISAFGHPVVECHCSCPTFRAGAPCHARVPDLQGEQLRYDLPCILMDALHELSGTEPSFLDFTQRLFPGCRHSRIGDQLVSNDAVYLQPLLCRDETVSDTLYVPSCHQQVYDSCTGARCPEPAPLRCFLFVFTVRRAAGVFHGSQQSGFRKWWQRLCTVFQYLCFQYRQRLSPMELRQGFAFFRHVRSVVNVPPSRILHP